MDIVLRIILIILGLQAIILMFLQAVHKLEDISGDVIYDEEEIHRHCKVVIWTNSKTGAQSFGWVREDDEDDDRGTYY